MDYEKIGFKCGIEIHQQVAGNKLFCSCPAINSTKKPDIRVTRNLRAVAGESGNIDIAAAHEMKKGRTFHYVSNSEDTCLVEYDEEPPHMMDKDALFTAIEICQMLNAKIVDEIQVMRKTVVDGSNVSGFQRTALVGYDGYVDTSLGPVRIPNICIEEEAAQKLNETKESATYSLDRLGITLIEIATEPDIKTPLHAKETAEIIGMLLRSTGRMKRGIGSIRQDVNISISGGARTEIKGFQDLKSIPRVIASEVLRQQKEIRKGNKLKKQVRKAEPMFTTSFLRPMPGAARMYPETDVPPIVPVISKLIKRETILDRIRRYEKSGLGPDLAKALAKSEYSGFFDKSAYKIKPAFIAETLVSFKKEINRDYSGADPRLVTEAHLNEIFKALDSGRISKDSVMEILVNISNGRKIDFSGYMLVETSQVEAEVRKIVAENKGASLGAVMGIAMKKYRGKVDGKVLSDILKKLMGES